MRGQAMMHEATESPNGAFCKIHQRFEKLLGVDELRRQKHHQLL